MLIFIHGFNSAGGSQKGGWFRNTFGDRRVELPTLPYEPERAIEMLAGLIATAGDDEKPVVLVGSSLGGFYAVYLAARFGLPAILINPLVDQTLLRQAIGPQENFYTGERYEWTAACCDQLDAMATAQEDLAEALTVPPLVLLDEADETLDSQLAASHFEGHGEVHLFPGGSHPFEHLPEALPAIRRYLDRQQPN